MMISPKMQYVILRDLKGKIKILESNTSEDLRKRDKLFIKIAALKVEKQL